MKVRKPIAGAIALAAVLAVGACGLEHKSNVLAPTDTGASTGNATQNVTSAMVGTWSSQTTLAPTLPDPKSCGNFLWTVSGQTATSINGTFSLACGEGVIVSGIASGTLMNSTTVNLTATGTGSMPGIPSCPFSITSVGTIADNNTALTIPYLRDNVPWARARHRDAAEAHRGRRTGAATTARARTRAKRTERRDQSPSSGHHGRVAV